MAVIRLQFFTMPPGSTLKETEAVVDRAAAIIARDPIVDRVFERINVGQGHVNIVLKKDRKVKSTEGRDSEHACAARSRPPARR